MSSIYRCPKTVKRLIEQPLPGVGPVKEAQRGSLVEHFDRKCSSMRGACQ
jgi:hypothetical protein